MNAALDEFLLLGFQDASLRSISSRAGVTTGALYGYFKSKEELFGALVDEVYKKFLEAFSSSVRRFQAFEPDVQHEMMGKMSSEFWGEIGEYMLAHRKEFKLLLCCAGGTPYDKFIHNLTELEADATDRFFQDMKKAGYPLRPVLPELEHILISGMFSAFFEVIIDDMPDEMVRKHIPDLCRFYRAGWMELMGF